MCWWCRVSSPSAGDVADSNPGREATSSKRLHHPGPEPLHDHLVELALLVRVAELHGQVLARGIVGVLGHEPFKFARLPFAVWHSGTHFLLFTAPAILPESFPENTDATLLAPFPRPGAPGPCSGAGRPSTKGMRTYLGEELLTSRGSKFAPGPRRGVCAVGYPRVRGRQRRRGAPKRPSPLGGPRKRGPWASPLARGSLRGRAQSVPRRRHAEVYAPRQRGTSARLCSVYPRVRGAPSNPAEAGSLHPCLVHPRVRGGQRRRGAPKRPSPLGGPRERGPWASPLVRGSLRGRAQSVPRRRHAEVYAPRQRGTSARLCSVYPRVRGGQYAAVRFLGLSPRGRGTLRNCALCRSIPAWAGHRATPPKRGDLGIVPHSLVSNPVVVNDFFLAGTPKIHSSVRDSLRRRCGHVHRGQFCGECWRGMESVVPSSPVFLRVRDAVLAGRSSPGLRFFYLLVLSSTAPVSEASWGTMRGDDAVSASPSGTRVHVRPPVWIHSPRSPPSTTSDISSPDGVLPGTPIPFPFPSTSGRHQPFLLAVGAAPMVSAARPLGVPTVRGWAAPDVDQAIVSRIEPARRRAEEED